jgi:muconate cycloisomerase
MNRELAAGLDPGQPIAKCAIDVAVHDLIGHRLGIPLQSWLGAKRTRPITLSRLISAAHVPTRREHHEISGRARATRLQGQGRPPQGARCRHRACGSVEAAPARSSGPMPTRLHARRGAAPVARLREAGHHAVRAAGADDDVYAMKKLIAVERPDDRARRSRVGLPYVIELIRREAVEASRSRSRRSAACTTRAQMCDLALNAGLTLIGSGLMDAPIGRFAAVGAPVRGTTASACRST